MPNLDDMYEEVRPSSMVKSSSVTIQKQPGPVEFYPAVDEELAVMHLRLANALALAEHEIQKRVALEAELEIARKLVCELSRWPLAPVVTPPLTDRAKSDAAVSRAMRNAWRL